MKANFEIVPLDFYPYVPGEISLPLDARLHALVDAFCLENLGQKVPMFGFGRAWVAATRGKDGQWEEVIGILGLLQAWDCPLFNVKPFPPNADRREKVTAMMASKALADRAKAYLRDTHNAGRLVFIYLDPRQGVVWEKFTEAVGAKPSNRFQMEI